MRYPFVAGQGNSSVMQRMRSAAEAVGNAEYPSPVARRIVLYTEATSRGGAEVSLRNLAAHLDPGLDVVLMGVSPEICEWIAAARPGATIHLVEPVDNKYAVGPFLALRRRLLSLGPAVFQANLRESADARHALSAATTARGIRPIAVEQLPLAPSAPTSRWLKSVLSRRLAAHVAVGHEVARAVERDARLPRESVRTIYNGVPDLGPAAPRNDGAGLVVGSLARLDRIKGIDVLLRAAAGLDGMTIVVSGDGPEGDRLRAQADELGLGGRFRIEPWSDSRRDLFDEIDIFALPSRAEGFPLSIVEAMLAGRPVVATDVGSVKEAVVDGATGLVVPPDDADALRAALSRLAADPEERRRMGTAGRVRALAHFTAEQMAREFERLYDELA
jgi:glycosyltransferase involved in cell wall biosynthesis